MLLYLRTNIFCSSFICDDGDPNNNKSFQNVLYILYTIDLFVPCFPAIIKILFLFRNQIG